MARALGATSYGYFVYATSWMAILLIGCNLGLKPTVVRFVAAYSARAEWGLFRGLLRSSTAWTIASLPVAAVTRAGSPRVRLASSTAQSAINGRELTASFTPPSQVITEIGVASDPVPAVVGTNASGSR